MMSFEVMSSEGTTPFKIICIQWCLFFLLPRAARRNLGGGLSQSVLQSWSTHSTRQGKALIFSPLQLQLSRNQQGWATQNSVNMKKYIYMNVLIFLFFHPFGFCAVTEW